MNRARLIESQQHGSPSADVKEVMAAQLKAALADGEEHIAKSLEALIALLMGLDELESRQPDDRDLILSLKNSSGELVNQLQFFDAHSQRVTHVAEAIIGSELLGGLPPEQNAQLLDELRGRYTCEAEHDVHRALVSDAETARYPSSGEDN